MSDPVLEVNDLVKHFATRTLQGFRAIRNTVPAVSGVSFN